MLEALLYLFLVNSIPDICFAPIAFAGIEMYTEIKDDIQRETAMMNDCVVYKKNYADCYNEWCWGYHEGVLDFQDLIGLSPEYIEENFIKGIQKIDLDSRKGNDYDLYLFFRQNMLVKLEYIRPLDTKFCSAYGQGDKKSFHVYSEILGKEGTLDFQIVYLDFLNKLLADAPPQMHITVTPCPKEFAGVITANCSISSKGE